MPTVVLYQVAMLMSSCAAGERRSNKLRRKLYPVVGFLHGPIAIEVNFNAACPGTELVG